MLAHMHTNLMFKRVNDRLRTLHLIISGSCGERSSGEEMKELHDDEPVLTRWYVQTVITLAGGFEQDVYGRSAEIDEDTLHVGIERWHIALYKRVVTYGGVKVPK
jgi:hypothetical protein